MEKFELRFFSPDFDLYSYSFEGNRLTELEKSNEIKIKFINFKIELLEAELIKNYDSVILRVGNPVKDWFQGDIIFDKENNIMTIRERTFDPTIFYAANIKKLVL